MHDPDGLLAAGRDLGPARLLEAYRHGIFPWYSEGQPVLWWSPDPRMVLYLDDFVISRSFAKTLRRLRREATWELRLDTAFERVMRECAAPRAGQDGTWINPQMLSAYLALNRAGLAHSLEVWCDGALIGGLYGVSIGRMFYGESMFARRADASKVALAALVQALGVAGFSVIDCQQNTRHLASLGATEISRERFLESVSTMTSMPAPDWRGLRIALPDA